MQLFNVRRSDPTEDRGAFIGGAICIAVFMMALIGLSKIAPPNRTPHQDSVSTLHVPQSSISR